MIQKHERTILHLGRHKNAKHKRVNCPNCGSRVIDAGRDTDTEVHELMQYESWEADYYMKCWKCKAIIGLKKLNRVS